MTQVFPLTPVLDTFTDAGQPQQLNVYDPTDWTTYGSAWGAAGNIGTTAGSTATVGAPNHGYYWQTQPANNMECYVTISTTASSTERLRARILNGKAAAGSNGTAAANCYEVVFNLAANTWLIATRQLGTIFAGGSLTISAGDSIGMRIVDALVMAFYRPTGGAWRELGEVTDTSVLGTGAIGLAGSTAGGVVYTNWGGGALPSAPADSSPYVPLGHGASW